MGNEIVYCHKCGERLLTSDFEKGRAFIVLKRNYCGQCSELVKAGNKPPAEATIRKHDERRQTRRIPIATPHRRMSRPMVIGMIVMAGVVLLTLIVIAMSRSLR